MPLISVVLAVYNGEAFLELSVRSVLAQTLVDFEFIIIDDCSTDCSVAILETMPDKRIKFFRHEHNRTLFPTLNELIGECKSRLIKLWSQDDIMKPGCLQEFCNFHHQHPGIGFSYSAREIIDGQGNIKPVPGIDHTPVIVSRRLHTRIAYFTGSIAGNIANVCINKDALDKVGLFNEGMKISADFDMWVRISEYFDIGFINKKLIELRDHEGQLSRKASLYLNHVKEDLSVYRYLDKMVPAGESQTGKKMLRKYKLVFYYTLMLKSLQKGDIRTAILFGKELNQYTGILPLTWAFIKAKMNKPDKPELFGEDRNG